MPLHHAFGVGELFEEVGGAGADHQAPNLAITTKVRRRASVRSDRQKAKQIVLNLPSNAPKFTPAGSVTMTAT